GLRLGGLIERAWRPAQNLQLTAPLLPGRCIEETNRKAILKLLQSGDHLRPEDDPSWLALDRYGYMPEPRGLVPAPGEDGLAVGAERHADDPGFIRHELADGCAV